MLMNKKKSFIIRHRFLLVSLLCLFGVCVVAQVKPAAGQQKKVEKKSDDSAKNKKGTAKKKPVDKRKRVDLLHADEAQADKLLRPDVQVLIGSVKLRHDSMYMYCDSALIYEKTNSVEAFSNVRMEQGDTLFIYGDYLNYNGETQLAMLRENVKLINRKTTLTTDSLNYDRLYNLGYYFEGGTLTDEENILTSDWGEYSPATKIAVFNHEVKLANPRFTLYSDTLKYSTDSKIATILGPSNIVNEKNHIYSERGFYNTAKDQAQLLDRSVLTNEGKKLVADSLFYDRKTGYGEAFYNVVMNDTINKNMLTGDYCFYNELTESALATQKAVAIDYSQGDSLFMHADTLKMNSYFVKTDSAYREMKAYHKVRIFRKDIQGVCDSLLFSSKDSCLRMYHDPIIWNEKQQLLGEEINVYMNDSTIDWAHIINQALTVEQKDSIHYNQISGKEIKAYFQGGEARKIDVIGNVLVIYYPEEKDSTMIGMNTSETSLLNLHLMNRKMEKMVMSPKSNGTLYPMDQIPVDKMKLPTFVWFDYIRPQNKEDIFNWRGKKSGETLRKTTRKPVTSPKRELNKLN
ncbi:OstA-like protein [Bacteroides graminisolvens]|uniref:OstA-like protein n=1 Tax=Bacteroides graminisolvens TaxID=477666 RepID=UPI000468147B|nr:OstA-like protein [Bacteroides graminisolvens]